MWTRILALVLFVLTLSTSAAHASEAPGELRLASAWSTTSVPANQKQIRATRGVLVAGAVIATSGALAFGIGVGTFDFYSSGTAPLIGMLYGVCAMPVGALLMLGGGIGLGVSVRKAKLAGGADHELHVAVAPSLVGTSPGLRIAARW